MECPYCGSDLDCTDWYMQGNDPNKKLGDIYQCSNGEGFEDLDLAKKFADEQDLVLGVDYDSLEDVMCLNDFGNNSYYTDLREDLHEGYPC